MPGKREPYGTQCVRFTIRIRRDVLALASRTLNSARTPRGTQKKPCLGAFLGLLVERSLSALSNPEADAYWAGSREIEEEGLQVLDRKNLDRHANSVRQKVYRWDNHKRRYVLETLEED